MPPSPRHEGQPHLSASILNADFSRLGEEVERAATGGVDSIHLDVMDGHFVDNLTFGPVVVEAARPHSALPFHSHLMISRPLAYAERFAQAGSDLIVFHVEADDDPRAVIAEIERAGKRPGIALNPETPAEAVLPWLDQVDLLLVMTVHPGWGGQAFIARRRPEAARPPRRGRAAGAGSRDRRGRGREPRDIGVADAGGGDVLVVGSALYSTAGDLAPTVAALRAAASAEAEAETAARRKDLTLLPRRSLWLGLVVLSLVGLLAACGENGPDLPFVPTPEPTPEQPRDVAVSVVTRGSEQAIEAAALEVDGTSALTDADGAATLTALRGATVSVSAEATTRVRAQCPTKATSSSSSARTS